MQGRNRLIFLLLILLHTGCALVVQTRAAAVPKTSIQGVYRGVYHVHSEFSRDSIATLEDISETAKKAKLDFVVITDHNTLKGETVARDMGITDPLLVFGEEITTEDGHLVALGTHEPHPEGLSGQPLIDWIHQKGGYAFISHPISTKTPWLRWEVEGIDGMEIYNFPHTLFDAGKIGYGTEMTFLPPRFFLKSFQEMPEAALLKWDRHAKKKPIAAVAAVDAHLRKDWLGFRPENLLLQFQSVTVYIRVPELTEENVIKALVEGKSYMAFEAKGEAQDFVFKANVDDRDYFIGESLVSWRPVVYTISVPKEATIRLIKDGSVVAEHDGTRLDHAEDLPGIYRAEVLQKGRPWVISNPIYAD